jgi:DNA-binding XRE family transcriptional regulator
MKKHTKNIPALPTGKSYASVREMMVQLGTSKVVLARFDELKKERLIIDRLVSMRSKAGLTQQELAAKMKLTQGAISKLESSSDADLTVREIVAYANATGRHHVGIVLDKEEFEPELAFA